MTTTRSSSATTAAGSEQSPESVPMAIGVDHVRPPSSERTQKAVRFVG